MLNPHLRRGLLFSAPFLLTLAMSISVSAQQTGQTGGTTGGQTGTDGTATGTGTGTGTDTGGTGAVGSLDADTVFSGIERGDAVGSTASTGTGFSSLDANAGGGRAAGIGGFGGGGLGGLGALFGLGGAGAGSQTTRPAIRTRLRSAINVQLTSPSVVQQVATQRLRSMSSQPQMRGINVSMQGKTAVISGVVRTERDRRMSELLMRLEPGVGSVDNRVIVIPQ